jgi:phenylpropionate dioxygenase-like ring-hydroxylating dioxygenase large terminal subunit
MNVQPGAIERSTPLSDPYARHGVPPLGFRNYWYPALLSRRLRHQPQRVVLLGEPVVIWRDGVSVYALADRCAHRGARLSRGRCEFPGSGTISCPYHGWTYDGRTGRGLAALMEGPRVQISPRNRVKAYPVEERAGIVWVFVGDMDAVPLSEDIPEWLLRDDWFAISVAVRYTCNWRALVDNWAQDWHANYVHRNSPEFFLQPAPFARDMIVAEIPGKKGVGYLDVGGVDEADFPGLGKWPHDRWHRVMKPRGLATVWFDSKNAEAGEMQDGSKFLKQLRLPAYILIGRGHRQYWLCQYATPIDADTTMLFNINIFKRRSLWGEIYDRAHYAVFRGWAHDWLFSGQDKRILDDWEIGPEVLSKTDMGVMQWRKFSVENARRPAVDAPASAATAVREDVRQ